MKEFDDTLHEFWDKLGQYPYASSFLIIALFLIFMIVIGLINGRSPLCGLLT